MMKKVEIFLHVFFIRFQLFRKKSYQNRSIGDKYFNKLVGSRFSVQDSEQRAKSKEQRA